MSTTWRGVLLLPATLALAGSLYLAAPANAWALQVHGVDSYLDQQEDGLVDLLQVDDANGETVFLKIMKGEDVIADHLAYTLGKTDDDSANIVSAYIGNFDPDATYTIVVYADRSETDLLYQGAIAAVKASVDGKDQVVAYTTKSEADDEASRALPLPATYTRGDDTYVLVDGKYELAADSEVADGQIAYVDEAGNVIKTTAIEGIAKGTSKKVAIPGIIKGDDGSHYRTITNTAGTVTASYPGTRSYTIRCKKVDDSVVTKKGFYTAKINLVDEQGTVLATDQVSVAGNVLYTAPSTLYLGSGMATRTYNLAGAAVLDLRPDTSSDATTRTFTVKYAEQSSDDKWEINVRLVAVDPATHRRNDLEGPKEPLEVTPQTPATYEVPQSVDVDGVTYVPANAPASYTFAWGEEHDSDVTIYYVPADYTPEESYQFDVAYVDIATGKTVDTKTYTVAPNGEDVSVQTPAQFVGADGTTYVRLNGQDDSISHGYYDRYSTEGPTYTVYYRDVNDDLNRDRVITRVRVRYVDGGTTTSGATGNTITDNGTTVNGASDTAVTRIAANGALSTVSSSGEDGSEQMLVNGEGNDLNTQRIDDDEMPLAAGEKGLAAYVRSGYAWIAALVAAAAALLVFFFAHHRKNDEDETANASEGR